MPTPEPITPEEWEAVKVLMTLPELQADAIRAVWPPEADRQRIAESLRKMAVLMRKGSKYRRAATFTALRTDQREKLLARMTPQSRLEALRELELLTQQDVPLDVGLVLDEMAETLLRHLED